MRYSNQLEVLGGLRVIHNTQHILVIIWLQSHQTERRMRNVVKLFAKKQGALYCRIARHKTKIDEEHMNRDWSYLEAEAHALNMAEHSSILRAT